MANRIGPTFGQELRNAGCANGVSWSDDGTLTFADGVDPTPARAVLAAHDPTKQLPADVCGDAIIGAIPAADRAKCDPLDLARIAWRDDVPTTNNKLVRIAKKLGATPDALRQAATGV